MPNIPGLSPEVIYATRQNIAVPKGMNIAADLTAAAAKAQAEINNMLTEEGLSGTVTVATSAFEVET